MKLSTTAALIVGISFVASAPPASADVVTEWNVAALNTIRAQRTPPPVASRTLAILHTSIYDAINGIDRTHEPFLVSDNVPASASREAAATAAAHRVLVTLYPALAASFDDLRDTLLSAIPDRPQKTIGLQWGEEVAIRILESRAADRSDAVVPPPLPQNPWDWQPTPPLFAGYLLPQWAGVTPFAMPAGRFMPPGPPIPGSTRYAEEYEEVRRLGAAVGSLRTPEQDQIALFWADGAGTETPPGHWNSIARDVTAARGNTLEGNARLFALLNVALADAAICAWEAKYVFHTWRPVTAIRNGDTDGDPLTVGDPEWNSFIVTPPFPDYVSGHSTFSSAAAAVLGAFYGTDAIAFTTGSDFLPGVTRSFGSFSAAASEAAISRLYGGIHTRSANEDGLTAGRAIGEWTFANVMQPKDNRAR